MIGYHFKVVRRVFGRNTFTSLINIFNIAIGMTAFILVVLWVKSELSFDDFNQKSKNIYRVTCEGRIFENNIKDATSGAILSKALPVTFPEIKDAAALLDFGTAMMSKPNGEGFRMKVFGATSSLFNIFSFPIVQGDNRSFDQPNNAFISMSAAQKIYGEENPVGKILSTGMDRENKQFTITGIIEDIPENSHLTFDFLFSLPSVSFYRNATNDWMNANLYTYLLLDENTNYKTFEAKLNEFLQDQIGPILKQWRNLSVTEWRSNGESWRFILQPLSKIHLYSSLKNEASQNGNITYIYMAFIIGLFILIISIINFVNLSTVQATARGKEIMVRKVLGASRKSITCQSLGESILKSFLALIVSIFFIPLIIPVLENKIGTNLFSGTQVTPSMYFWLLLFPLITGVIAGLYPAFVVSRMAPLKAMAIKNSEIPQHKLMLKDVLLIMQFTISVMVIISTIAVSRQLDYLQNKKLGFKKENILILRQMEDMSHSQQHTFSEKLVENNQIKTASFSHRIPGMSLPARTLAMTGEKDLQLLMLEVCPVDPSFFSTYGIELAEGDFFNEETSKGIRKIILNESAVRIYNIKEPVGKRLYYSKTDYYEIAGIIKDFHYNSKRKEIQAAAFVQEPDIEMFWSPEYLSLGITGSVDQILINSIKSEYHKILPGKEFVYSFFDEDYDSLYKNELQTKQLYSLFSLIAICLSCLGLYGLVNYILLTKVKEIGVRKINGATTANIFVILSGKYLKWILVAFSIATPLAYFVMNRWLENFAYKANLSWWIFALAGLLAFGIALLTVSWQTWRAATRNPVEALRYE